MDLFFSRRNIPQAPHTYFVSDVKCKPLCVLYALIVNHFPSRLTNQLTEKYSFRFVFYAKRMLAHMVNIPLNLPISLLVSTPEFIGLTFPPFTLNIPVVTASTRYRHLIFQIYHYQIC